MKAYQMTIAEYQQQVSPLFKQLFDYAKKHKSMLIIGDFNRVLLHDFAAAVADWYGGYQYYTPEERVLRGNTRWYDAQGVAPQPLSDEVRQGYERIIAELGEFFQAEQLTIQPSFSRSIQRDEQKSNKREVRRALDMSRYAADVDAGSMTIERVNEILDSVGIRMPANLLKLEAERKRQILYKSNPTMKRFMDTIYTAFESQRGYYIKTFTDLFARQCAEHPAKVNESTGSLSRERIIAQLNDPLQARYRDLFMFDPTTKGKSLIIPTLDQAEQIDKIVARVVAELGEQLMYTLGGKVDMVLSDLVDVETLHLQRGSKGFEGEFQFTLTNGSFIIETKSILAWGEINRPHYRYLAHYRNVEAGGEALKIHTFEQMVLRFGKELGRR